MSSKSRCKSPDERLFKLTLERSQQSSDREARHRPWDRLLTHRPYLTRVELATIDRELFYNKGSFALTGGHALSFEAQRQKRAASGAVMTLAGALHKKLFGVRAVKP